MATKKPTAKRKPVAKPAEKDLVRVARSSRSVTELLTWNAELYGAGDTRYLEVWSSDGKDITRLMGITDDVAAQLVRMLTPQPPTGPVVG